MTKVGLVAWGSRHRRLHSHTQHRRSRASVRQQKLGKVLGADAEAAGDIRGYPKSGMAYMAKMIELFQVLKELTKCWTSGAEA